MSEHTKLHKASHILIEDAGFGSALIQEAKTADFSVIAVKAEKSEWPYKPAKSMKAL